VTPLLAVPNGPHGVQQFVERLEASLGPPGASPYAGTDPALDWAEVVPGAAEPPD
jgi:hypothetical protein